LYTLIFSEIIGIRFREVAGDSALNFGLYLYCGLIPFLAFSDAVNGAINSVRRNTALVQKVVFPLEILPATKAISTVVDKVFGLAVLIAVVAILEGRLNWTVLLFPAIFAVQLVFTLGLSYLFAVIGTYLPDAREMLRSIVRVSFFVTPIIWPPELAEERGLDVVVDYNPLAFLVGAYRNLVLDGAFPDPTAFMWFSLFAVALFVVGFALFARVKRRFPDLL
ncbi:MAG: ABC transporter permease, partial [Rubrobacteraceae bacterium]